MGNTSKQRKPFDARAYVAGIVNGDAPPYYLTNRAQLLRDAMLDGALYRTVDVSKDADWAAGVANSRAIIAEAAQHLDPNEAVAVADALTALLAARFDVSMLAGFFARNDAMRTFIARKAEK